MSAAQALRAAREAGIQVEMKSASLKLKAATRPPQEVVELLKRHKAEVMALLRRESGTWTPEDWRAFWGERAGIAEFDGGLSREAAEAQAFAACVAEWFNQHPVASDPRGCAHCGRTDDMGDPLVPAGVEAAVVWLHPDCWSEWHQRPQGEAARALRDVDLSQLAGRAQLSHVPTKDP